MTTEKSLFSSVSNQAEVSSESICECGNWKCGPHVRLRDFHKPRDLERSTLLEWLLLLCWVSVSGWMLGETAIDEVDLRGSFGLGCILAKPARSDERARVKARRNGATELLGKSRLGTTLQPAIDRWAALTRKPLGQ
jgi:hypothetical protein